MTRTRKARRTRSARRTAERTVGILAAVIAAAVAIAAAQQIPTFRSGVDLVQVDVTVLDKSGKPVRGLTAAEFTILEDSKPQTIAAFSAVDIPDAPALPVVGGKTVTWVRDAPADVQANDPSTGRLVVMLVDDCAVAARSEDHRQRTEGDARGDRQVGTDRSDEHRVLDGRPASTGLHDRPREIAGRGGEAADRPRPVHVWLGIDPAEGDAGGAGPDTQPSPWARSGHSTSRGFVYDPADDRRRADGITRAAQGARLSQSRRAAERQSDE